MSSAPDSALGPLKLNVKDKENWSKDNINHFDSVLRRLEAGELKSARHAAKLCGISSTTFQDILGRGIKSYADFAVVPKAGRPRKLTAEEEKEAFLNLTMLHSLNLHYTLPELCRRFAVYASRPGCAPWDDEDDGDDVKPLDPRTVKSMLERNRWSIKKTGRAGADKWYRATEAETAPHFDWLRTINAALEKPGNELVANMDESSVVLPDSEITPPVASPKGTYPHTTTWKNITVASGHTTVVPVVGVYTGQDGKLAGRMFGLMIIFKSDSRLLEHTLLGDDLEVQNKAIARYCERRKTDLNKYPEALQAFKDAFGFEPMFAMTKRGFNNKRLNTQFCETIAAGLEEFMDRTKCAETCYLTLDNVASHTLSKPLTKSERVKPHYFPPRTTGDLQPCDHSSLFGQFKKAYKKRMQEFHSRYQRNIRSSRTSLATVVLNAFVDAFKEENIVSAFRGCGIGDGDKVGVIERRMDKARAGNHLVFGINAIGPGDNANGGVLRAEAEPEPESDAEAHGKSDEQQLKIKHLQSEVHDMDLEIQKAMAHVEKLRLEQVDRLAELDGLGASTNHVPRLVNQVSSAFSDSPEDKRSFRAFASLVAPKIANTDARIIDTFKHPSATSGRLRRSEKIRLEENVARTPSQLIEQAKRDIAAQPQKKKKKKTDKPVTEAEQRARQKAAQARNMRKKLVFKDLTDAQKAEYAEIPMRDTEAKDAFLGRHEKRKAADAPEAVAAPAKRGRVTRSTRSTLRQVPRSENMMDDDEASSALLLAIDDDDDDDDGDEYAQSDGDHDDF